MGGDDLAVSAVKEPTLKYHPCAVGYLTLTRESGQGTVLGGQFDWGGFLLKSKRVAPSRGDARVQIRLYAGKSEDPAVRVRCR